jgi:hypothetical protein
MEFAVRGGLKMDRIRLIAALTNSVLVLTLYSIAWGTPTFDIAMLELSLAAGAGVSTWYALRGIRRYRA